MFTQVTSSPRNPGRFTRAQRSAKRGGGRPQQPLDDAVEVGAVVEPSAAATSDLVDLDRALAALEVQDAHELLIVDENLGRLAAMDAQLGENVERADDTRSRSPCRGRRRFLP